MANTNLKCNSIDVCNDYFKIFIPYNLEIIFVMKRKRLDVGVSRFTVFTKFYKNKKNSYTFDASIELKKKQIFD